MKRKFMLVIIGIGFLSTACLIMFGFVWPTYANSAPNLSPEPENSKINIHCSACGTSDYATVMYKCYTSDCEGYSPDWIELGSFYFNSSGNISIPLAYQCGYILASFIIYKENTECDYYGMENAGYHVPCNPNVINLNVDVDYPWPCPYRN